MADDQSTAISLSSKCVVYGLYDPRSDELRYIGKTKDGARRRLIGHICDSRRYPHKHIARWIACLAAQNLRPTYRVLEASPVAEGLGELERQWIAKARSQGARLTNVTDGGDGGALGLKHSEETLAKFRARPDHWTGRKHTDESKELMAEAQRRRFAERPEMRVAMSQLHKGRKHSAAHRQAESDRSRAMWARSSYRKLRQEIVRTSANVADGHRRQALKMIGRKRPLSAVLITAMKSRKAVIDQHGTIYTSMKDAGAVLGVSPSNISAVVNGHRPHTCGFVFRRYDAEATAGGD